MFFAKHPGITSDLLLHLNALRIADHNFRRSLPEIRWIQTFLPESSPFSCRSCVSASFLSQHRVSIIVVR
jgi:hypothetical protein